MSLGFKRLKDKNLVLDPARVPKLILEPVSEYFQDVVGVTDSFFKLRPNKRYFNI